MHKNERTHLNATLCSSSTTSKHTMKTRLLNMLLDYVTEVKDMYMKEEDKLSV